MEIKYSERPKEEAASVLEDMLKRHREAPVLLMLSGGSALTLLDGIDDTLLGPWVTLSVLDERCSADPSVSNFSQITTLDFFRRAVDCGVGVIDTSFKEGERCEDGAEHWQAALRAWRAANPNGVVLATIGVGEDGHTAGIFPVAGIDFNGSNQWVVAYTLPEGVNEYRERMTVSNTFLKHEVQEAVVYVSGEGKRSVVRKLRDGVCTPSDMPSCIFYDMKEVTLITDLC